MPAKKRKIIERDGKYYTARGAELTRNANTMTESEFWSWIRSTLRRLSIYWKPKNEALDKAKRPYTGSNKRQKWEYQCNMCKKYYIKAKVEADHIEPAGTLTCAHDLPGFVERLFCDALGYQILCESCHSKKTNDKLGEKDE